MREVTMPSECHHIQPDGKKCRAMALRGGTLCRHHTPSREQKPIRRYAVRRTNLLGDLPEINSLEAIAAALNKVVHALANGSISAYRAQALITTLQLASKNLRS